MKRRELSDLPEPVIPLCVVSVSHILMSLKLKWYVGMIGVLLVTKHPPHVKREMHK